MFADAQPGDRMKEVLQAAPEASTTPARVYATSIM